MCRCYTNWSLSLHQARAYLAVEGLGNLADRLRHLVRLIARLDQPQGGLAAELSCQEDISLASIKRLLSLSLSHIMELHLLASDGIAGGAAHHHGVSHHGYEAVNVSSHVDLDQVAIGQDHVRLRDQRREVTDTVVH